MSFGGGSLLFLLGAGASVDSGLATYRGPSGMYSKNEKCNSNDPLVNPLHFSALYDAKRRCEMWHKVLGPLFRSIQKVQHLGPTYQKIQSMIDGETMIATQNVDGLALTLGVSNTNTTTIELHGNIQYTLCLDCSARTSFEDTQQRGFTCGVCHSENMRPDILLFGESIAKEKLAAIFTFLKRKRPTHVFIIGTSMQFPYLHLIVNKAIQQGAFIVHVNNDPDYFHHTHTLKAKTDPSRVVRKRRRRPHILLTSEEFLCFVKEK